MTSMVLILASGPMRTSFAAATGQSALTQENLHVSRVNDRCALSYQPGYLLRGRDPAVPSPGTRMKTAVELSVRPR